ncbi:ESPR-type extended signal peptide-containing protein [Variovorax sp. YR216]|uniref:ESPR-type extended signal peptide-containing protein n=1 Tax=Variovorax sp. YR216 TaxID=1882828 RepID=UPI00089C6CE2|nr:YadA-like family protein [Variovorax sp. YR216]SEB26224.1 Head domain of trimeric autotransporter adhesin [Variovorax sp. YR216]
MNRIFKTVWCEETGTFVATSETSKARGKKSSSARAGAAGLIAGVLLSLGGAAQAVDYSIENLKILDGVGADASATGPGSIAMGVKATAQGATGGDYSAIAIGANTTASGQAALAMGEGATATGNRTISVGNSSTATGNNVTAFGADSKALFDGAASFGASAQTAGAANTAIGFNSQVGTAAAPVGAWTLQASKEGTARTDGLGLNITNGMPSVAGAALGENSLVTASGGVALGGRSTVSGIGGLAVGSYSTAAGRNSMAVGSAAYSSGLQSMAIGSYSAATMRGATAIGASATAKGEDATAIGSSAVASGRRSIALGAAMGAQWGSNQDMLQNTTSNAKATGDDSIAIGTNASAIGDRSLSLGMYSSATNDKSVAIGSFSKAQADLTIPAYNPSDAAIAGATPDAEFSVGDTAKERRVTNVAAGASNTDAVNVSQIKATDANVAANKTNIATNTTNLANLGSKTATALGGGTAFDPATGSLNGTSFALTKANAINGTTGAATNVGAGFDTVDAALGNVSDSVTGISDRLSAGTVGLLQQAAAGADLTVGKGTNGAAVDFAASGGATRRLKNVSDGVANNDAVNVKQLNATDLKATTNATNLGNLGSKTATALGGGTAFDPATGSLNGTSFALTKANAINGTTGAATNVGAGFDTVDAALGNLDGRISAGTVGLVQQAAAGADLTVGKGTNGAAVDFAASGGATRTLKNVTAGVANTDAVNVAQLKATGLVDNGGNTVSAVTFNGPSGEANAAGQKIINVAAGTALTDAVNMAQLKATGLVDNGGNTVNAVTFNGPSGEANVSGKKIINVAAGTAAMDAVNVAQLSTANQSVATAIGGGTAFDPVSGSLSGTSFALAKANAINGTTGAATNVGAGFDKVDTALGNLDGRISAGTVGLVQQAAAGADLTVGKGTDGAAVDFATVGGATRTLKNVTAGVANTDAVNVAQLKSIGLVDTGGNTVNAVTFNGPSGEANVAGKKIINVAAGTDNTDAVNVAQLKATGLVDTGGNTVNAVTFNGPSGEANVAGQKIINVAAGTANTDAVNVAQLKATGLVDTSGNTVSAVTFNGPSGEANAAGQKIINVAAGTANTDAVNVAQLKATGLVDAGGNTVNAVTFNGPSGEANMAGQKIINVANGTANTDAVNVSQLNTANQSVATAIGGGTTFDPVTGTLSGTSFALAKSNAINGTSGAATSVGAGFDKVDAALGNLDSRIVGGTVGLVQQAAAGADLTVGKGTDGAAVDFAASGGATRTLKNVSDGVANNDAVNVKQLKSIGLVDNGGNTVNAVTFNGPSGEANVAGKKIINVADGAVDSDAVNMGQLRTTVSSSVANAVMYDDASHSVLTLGGAGASATVRLKNVADGTDDNDAVNVRQLRSSGLVDPGGNLRDAVAYDAGSSRGVITFGGGTDGTLLANVRDGRIGTDSREAVNGGQIASLQAKLDSRIDGIDGRVANIEANGVGGGTPAFVDGNANGKSATKADAGDTAGVAVGYNSKATGDNASVVGQNAAALGSYGTAIGNDSYAAGPNDTALGGNAKVFADGSVAVGANASVTSATATNAVAVGADTQVSAASATAIGQGAKVTASANGAVALGQGSVADRANTVSVGSAGNERAIANVAAGTAPTDAVNVQQLQDSQQQSTAYTDMRVNQVQSELAGARRDSNAAAASAMAVANLPQSIIPGKGMASAAVSNMDGESAVAVGVSKASEDGRWVTKLSATVNTRGKAGVGAGIGFHW